MRSPIRGRRSRRRPAPFVERGDEVVVKYESGQEVVADLLIAADGIQSKISEQAFGDPGIFHIGIRAFLAWCEDFGGIDRDFGVTHHVEFARKLGDQFHKAPAPVAWLRDTVLDNTKVLDKLLRKDYLADSEKMSLLLKELHV